MSLAFEPFELPNGVVLKNRICKAAMEENLADVDHFLAPSHELIELYRAWGKGGSALALTGHVMIDPRALGSPGALCLCDDLVDSDSVYLDRFRHMIEACKEGGAEIWLQINHPGRQTPKALGQVAKGPSAVAVDIGRLSRVMFDTPVEMTEEDIQDVIRRFARTAALAEELGAGGIEVHAAHGYLLSAFASPIANKRTDRWGGSLENRTRLVFEVVKAIKREVKSPKFGVGVKINSADFQRGGFEEQDALHVIETLNTLGVDFIEVSGGSYESPAMRGINLSSRSAQREAYFLDFAEKAAALSTVPIMCTGGIVRRKTLDQVVASGKTIAGIATAIGIMPDLPNRLERGEDPAPRLKYTTSWVLSGSVLASATTRQVNYSMERIGRGKEPCPAVWPAWALLMDQVAGLGQASKYKKVVVKYLDERDGRAVKRGNKEE
ncbi:hypothetical protein JCM10296v2_007441 [Rhodotorula toruloides]